MMAAVGRHCAAFPHSSVGGRARARWPGTAQSVPACCFGQIFISPVITLPGSFCSLPPRHVFDPPPDHRSHPLRDTWSRRPATTGAAISRRPFDRTERLRRLPPDVFVREPFKRHCLRRRSGHTFPTGGSRRRVVLAPRLWPRRGTLSCVGDLRLWGQLDNHASDYTQPGVVGTARRWLEPGLIDLRSRNSDGLPSPPVQLPAVAPPNGLVSLLRSVGPL